MVESHLHSAIQKDQLPPHVYQNQIRVEFFPVTLLTSHQDRERFLAQDSLNRLPNRFCDKCLLLLLLFLEVAAVILPLDASSSMSGIIVKRSIRWLASGTSLTVFTLRFELRPSHVPQV